MSIRAVHTSFLGVNFLWDERELNTIKASLKDAFSKVKEEFDEHLQSINENTNEIQANYEYICRLDAKIDKLSERIDGLCMQRLGDRPQKEYIVQALTIREKEVFLGLYTSDAPIGYKELAKKTGLSEELVLCYISNLINKGVKILRKYSDGVVAISIEPQFREHQMRENIVGISEELSGSLAKTHFCQ